MTGSLGPASPRTPLPPIGRSWSRESWTRRAALVFDAWTNPTHVPQWLLGPEGWTMPVCEIDLRPGGSWRYVWRKTDGTEMAMAGSYREFAPPERLVSTERWGPEWPETINT